MTVDSSFFENVRLLVVDDHMLMRSIITQNLRAIGFTNIDTAQNGQEAWEIIQSKKHSGIPYNIVFLDWHMPILDGISVLKKCRQDKKFDDMAIIMITAEQEQNNVLHAIESGATSYIVKPTSQDALEKNVEKIAKWLEKKGNMPEKTVAKADTAAGTSSALPKEMSNQLKPIIAKGIENIFSNLFNAQIVPESHVGSSMQGTMICVGKLHQKNMTIFIRFFFDQDLLRPLLMQLYSPKFLEDKNVYSDAASEIVNILCSQVKAFLNGHGYELNLDIPEVFTEKREMARSDSILNIRFSLNNKKYFLVDVSSGSGLA